MKTESWKWYEKAIYYATKGLYALLIAFFIWAFVSYLDVYFQNTSRNPEYAPWNLFELSLEVFS